MSIKFAVLTNTGQKRQVNEDSLWPQTAQHDHEADDSNGMLFMVADGMGGHGSGDIASNLAVTEIPDKYYSLGPEYVDINQRLEIAIHSAHQLIREVAAQSPETENMGTTVVTAVVKFDETRFRGEAWLAWVGDSRIYLSRGGKLRQLSRDHSRVWPLIEAGQITWDGLHTHPDRSKITNALIAKRPDAVPEFLHLELEPGDKLMLCSDGLSGEVRPEDIEQTLALYPPDQAAALLIDKANASKEIITEGQPVLMDGGNDNISVIIIKMPVDQTVTQSLGAVAPPVGAAGAASTPVPPAPVAKKTSRLGLVTIVGLLLAVGLVGGALVVVLTNPSIFAPTSNVAAVPSSVETVPVETLAPTQNAIIVAVGSGDEQSPATNNTPNVAAVGEVLVESATDEIRMPTVTRGPIQTPTSPPTATNTPSPVSTPTPTEVVTSTAVLTVDISNVPVPVLVEPEGDETGKFPRDTSRETKFVWQWPDDLPDDMGFEIMVWLKDKEPTGAHDARFLKEAASYRSLSDNRYTVSLVLEGANGVTTTSADYLWTVAIVRTEPDYQWLGIIAEPRPISLVVPDSSGARQN